MPLHQEVLIEVRNDAGLFNYLRLTSKFSQISFVTMCVF